MIALKKMIKIVGDVAALVKSHMSGLQPFESTIEQTTETMPPSHKPKQLLWWRQIELQAYESCYSTENCLHMFSFALCQLYAVTLSLDQFIVMEYYLCSFWRVRVITLVLILTLNWKLLYSNKYFTALIFSQPHSGFAVCINKLSQ